MVNMDLILTVLRNFFFKLLISCLDLSGVGDARLNLAQNLGKLSVSCPGRLNPLLATGLTDSDRAHLKTYLDGAHVQIA